MAKNRMTKFLAKELMYDYISGSLSDKKAKSLEDFIASDEELKQELEALKRANHYSANLKRISLTQPYLQDLNDYVQKEGSVYYIKKGAYVGFKYGSIAVVIALVIFYFPTKKVIQYFERDPNKVVLAEVKTSDDLQNIPMAMHGDLEDDEELAGLLKQEEGATTLGDQLNENKTDTKELTSEEKQNLAKQLQQQEEDLEMAAKEEANQPVEPVVKSDKTEKPSLQGVLYRAFLKVDEKDIISTAVLQKLKELQAKKAGSVRMGWQKPNGNSYFHFKISETNFEIFKTYINTIKKIEINSYPHPRVMEDGFVRMILEVEKK